MAEIPEGFVEVGYSGGKRILDMREGETGWATQWSYKDGMLDQDAPVFPEGGGTVSLFIVRERYGHRLYLRKEDA